MSTTLRSFYNHLRQHWLSFVVLTLMVISVMAIRASQGNLQQDNYLNYSQALTQTWQTGQTFYLPRGDWRLLPGLPLLIGLVKNASGDLLSWVSAGYLLILTTNWLSLFLIQKLLPSAASISHLWILLFPPIVMESLTIISTEAVFITGTLLIIWLLEQNRIPAWFLGWIAGSLVWIRLTALVFLPVLWWRYRHYPLSLLAIFGQWLSWLLLLLCLNYWLFSPHGITNPFLVQIKTYQEVGRAQLALVQLLHDIPRAWQWGWYRILASGVAYLGYLLGLIITVASLAYLNRHYWQRIFWQSLIAGSLFAFVFSIGPTPFLEEFARFLVPFFVVVQLALVRFSPELFKKYWWGQAGLIGLAVVVSII